MRLALISDIHANYEALNSLSDVLSNVDLVLCLGDTVGYYCQVNEVIDSIRSLNALCILGNHDSYLLNGCPANTNPAVRFGIEFAERIITAENRQWLASLPLLWGGVIGERSFLLTHGSPWRPLDDYLYANNPTLTQLDAFDYDVIAFSQTHRSMQRLEQRPYLLNPGSVGQSRDLVAHSCSLVMDTETMIVEKVQRAFDPISVIDLCLQNGAGPWINKHLKTQ